LAASIRAATSSTGGIFLIYGLRLDIGSFMQLFLQARVFEIIKGGQAFAQDQEAQKASGDGPGTADGG
jgi:hypothetical protein